jgi:hypothetical protein
MVWETNSTSRVPEPYPDLAVRRKLCLESGIEGNGLACRMYLHTVACGRCLTDFERIVVTKRRVIAEERLAVRRQYCHPTFGARRQTAPSGSRQFEEFLLADVTIARQALKKVLAERIQWHPEEYKDGRRYLLRLALRVAPLLDEGHAGASATRSKLLSANCYNSVASPRGFDHVISAITLPCEGWLQAA